MHDFVKHTEGKHIPFEDRLVTEKLFLDILSNKISSEEHQELYDFHNPDVFIMCLILKFESS